MVLVLVLLGVAVVEEEEDACRRGAVIQHCGGGVEEAGALRVRRELDSGFDVRPTH